MVSGIIVEVLCPKHGLERFRIDIIKKYNVDSKAIIYKFRKKPTKQLSKLIVGRNVTEKEVQNALVRYFKETGMMEIILNIKLVR